MRQTSHEHVTLLDVAVASAHRAPATKLVEQHTLGDVNAAADALAAALLDRGFLFGDRLAIAVPDGKALVIALLAAWKAGGSAVLVDPAASAEETTDLLVDSGATALLSEGEHDTVPASSATAVHIVISGAEHLRDLVALHAGERPLASAPDPDDIAVHAGVTHTHRELASAARRLRDRTGATVDDRILVLTPLSADPGLTCELALALLVPCPLVLHGDGQAPTIGLGPPGAWQRVEKSTMDLSALRARYAQDGTELAEGTR